MPSHWQTLQDWIAIPSITGDEANYADALAQFLGGRGFAIERQQVAPGRFNLLARAGEPRIVFCTHLDTVPPFIAPSEDREFVHGRGACDAKGQALAMIEAATRLVDSGEDQVGFLFTVGEETDSVGAQVANTKLASPWAPRFTIVGEPTGNQFVSGHKGIFKAQVCAHGVAGHSSQPDGQSAIHALVQCLSALLQQDWGEHAFLGRGTLNIGEISGGIAANVFADRAEATLMLRAVEEPTITEQKLLAHMSEYVRLEHTFKNYAPTEFHVPAGETAIPVAFGTDAPHLRRWGKPLLFGPGHILDAHTEHERILKRDFERAIDTHVRTARELLQQDRA